MAIISQSVPDVNSLPAEKLQSIVLFHHRRNEDENATVDDIVAVHGGTSAYSAALDVWADAPDLWEEDYTSYVRDVMAEQASPSAPTSATATESTTASTPLTPTEGEKLAPQAVLDRHNAFITRIAGYLAGELETQGERNLRIGRETLEHIRWQRESFPGFSAQDFDRTCNAIHTEVCVLARVDSDHLRIGSWVRAALLRSLVVEAKGEEHASALSHAEYVKIVPRAMTFDKKDVTGAFIPGWLDFILGVSSTRLSGVRVSVANFTDRLADHEHALKTANAPKPAPVPSMTPEQRAVAEAARQKEAAKEKRKVALTAIKDAVKSAFSDTDSDVSMVLASVQQAAETQGHKVSAIEPATLATVPLDGITIQSLDRIIDHLTAQGMLAELLHMRNRADAIIAAARAAHQKAKEAAALAESTAAELVAA